MNELKRLEMEIRISELESRLEESEQLIDAIKAGEVDAFAINKNNSSEIYTLQSGDYAYRILIEEFGEGALNVTEDGLIVYTNPYFCKLLKKPYDEVIGARFTDFVDKKSQEQFEVLFKAAISINCKGEINLCTGTTLIPVSVSLTSLQPKLATVGIIVTDYTEKKKTENVILEYQKDLEQNNKELRHSNAELASFVYVASHDLQEPLRKIQTFASRIKEKELENLSESGIDFFSRMQLAAHRMQALIEDLLTYSRTNNPERTFIKSDLSIILDEVLLDMNEEILAKHASVETLEMCHADIIPFQFKQLLNNLIGNSLKFAKPDNAPHITIMSQLVKGTQVDKISKLSSKRTYCHIRIADKGIGFKQQYGEKIFEVFQRLHTQSEFRGTGIGLAIVKKIVDNHDGVILANSSPNKGAIFDIFLPTRKK